MKQHYEAVRETNPEDSGASPHICLEGDDLSASTPNIRVDVESLRQMINRAGARHRTGIQKRVNAILKNRSKSVEEPAVRTDLLLVLLHR